MLQSSTAGLDASMGSIGPGTLMANNAGGRMVQGFAYGIAPKQLSPMLDDTLAAVMHSNLGGSSPLECPPDCWTDAMSHQAASTSYNSGPSSQQSIKGQQQLVQQQLLLMQQREAQLQAAAASAAAAADHPNAVLYANYRSHHPQAYAEADRLSYGSEMSSATALGSTSHHQLNMLAGEHAFQARQLAQLQQQQQQLAYEHAQATLQQQQLLTAHMQQQASAGTSSLQCPPSASSHIAMTHQQRLPSSAHTSLHHTASSSMQQSSTAAAARLPPRPATAHSQHYHPYSSSAAAGGAIAEHHSTDARHSYHHQHNSNSLVAAAAAAAARTASLQQQQQRSTGNAPGAHPTAAAAAAAAAAALQRSTATGRWSGAVGVLDQSCIAGTQESGVELECDEELHSMDGFDQTARQHMMHSNVVTSAPKGTSASADTAVRRAQLQGGSTSMRPPTTSLSGGAVQQAAAASAAARAAAAGYALNALADDDQSFDMYEDSGSTHAESDNPSDDMDADTTLQQDQQQRQGRIGSSADPVLQPAAGSFNASAGHNSTANREAVALRVLSTVANRRKGEEVLTAHPAVAEAAGARSVRTRLLITEVSLYCESAATSLMAMDQSNRLMAKMTLPDGIAYMPVSTDSFLFKAAHAWQFPSFVICLGSSYMQRMLAKLPQLSQAALACPGFEDYCRYLPNVPAVMPAKLTGEAAEQTTGTLRSILFTCLFIATKVADQVHALGLLRFILTHLSHNGMVVSLQQAIDIEARTLDALDWRLGPFFEEDELTDEDLELWASAMGHWDYGTPADGSMLGY